MPKAKLLFSSAAGRDGDAVNAEVAMLSEWIPSRLCNTTHDAEQLCVWVSELDRILLLSRKIPHNQATGQSWH